MAVKCVIIGVVSAICALLFHVIAIATPYWLAHDTAHDVANVGIFRMCYKYKGDCGDLGDLYSLLDADFVVWFHISQGFYLLTCLLSMILVIVPVLLHFKFFEASYWYFPIAGVSLKACVAGLVPIVILGYFGPGLFVLNSHRTSLDWSYCMAIVGSFSSLISASAFCIQGILQRRTITLSARPIVTVWQKPYSVFVNEEN